MMRGGLFAKSPPRAPFKKLRVIIFFYVDDIPHPAQRVGYHLPAGQISYRQSHCRYIIFQSVDLKYIIKTSPTQCNSMPRRSLTLRTGVLKNRQIFGVRGRRRDGGSHQRGGRSPPILFSFITQAPSVSFADSSLPEGASVMRLPHDDIFAYSLTEILRRQRIVFRLVVLYYPFKN